MQAYGGPLTSELEAEDEGPRAVRLLAVLSLTNISLRRGRKVLIEKASFQVHAGQRMGLIGANGSGKSSLFAMLLGELEPDDGELGLHPDDEIAHVAPGKSTWHWLRG